MRGESERLSGRKGRDLECEVRVWFVCKRMGASLLLIAAGSFEREGVREERRCKCLKSLAN